VDCGNSQFAIRNSQCRGTVLFIVMVLVAMSAMTAAGLLYRMRAETAAAAASGSGEQAYTAAMSGLQAAMSAVGSPLVDLNDNPELFQNQLVCDDGANKWYFTVFAANDDGKTLRYGLEDESGKININTASADVLRAMFEHEAPNCDSDELVDCLIDYRGGESSPRPHGAKQDYYDKLKYPYLIKNGPLGTLEELLLVKGFTAQIVYGEDANFNGILDPNEDDGDKSFPPDNADGVLDRGLYALATAVTHEPNTDSRGRRRVNINGTDAEMRALSGIGLSKQTVDFIKACRADGYTFKDPSELLGMEYPPKNAPASGPAPKPTTAPGAKAAPNKSGVGADELPLVMDRLTTVSAARNAQRTGLVNVNTASATVLSFLPGLDENLAKTIADSRGTLDSAKKDTVAWLFTENLITADQFKQVAPFLTARSRQYRLRAMGFGVPCGRYRLIEAILDLSGPAPRVAYLRDVTRVGLPMAIDVDRQERRQ